MIVVIDNGISNVCSVLNMLKKIGADSILTNDPAQIEEADKLILPGVGSFDSGMQSLKSRGFIDAIKLHAVEKGKPMLGICLGMQMLGRGSEEGKESGLNLIPFDNKRFDFGDNTQLKIPHMGWDIVETIQKNDLLTEGLSDNQRYYFVHSYHAVCDNNENILMTCDYGYPFTAAVKMGKIYGVQFHPEKSHKFGMNLLENFVWRV